MLFTPNFERLSLDLTKIGWIGVLNGISGWAVHFHSILHLKKPLDKSFEKYPWETHLDMRGLVAETAQMKFWALGFHSTRYKSILAWC